MTTVAAPQEGATPEAEAGHPKGVTTAMWGMVVLIMTEATIFAGLLASYFFIRAASTEWPLDGIEPPELKIISFFTVILLGSSIPMAWAERGIRKGQQWRLRLGLALVLVMGGSFFGFLTLVEYPELHFGVRDNAYGSLFYAITGLHGAHVVGGLLMIGMLLIKASMGRFSAERHRMVAVVGMYWHFVDTVWVFVFSSLYLSSHIH